MKRTVRREAPVLLPAVGGFPFGRRPKVLLAVGELFVRARSACVIRGLNRSRLESRHYRVSSGIGPTICIKCLSGYVTCKHNLGPVNCVCLPCDSSPITERVCTHNTQPSDRVNLFIYYHDLNTFRHLDHNACYHIPIGILCK